MLTLRGKASLQAIEGLAVPLKTAPDHEEDCLGFDVDFPVFFPLALIVFRC